MRIDSPYAWVSNSHDKLLYYKNIRFDCVHGLNYITSSAHQSSDLTNSTGNLIVMFDSPSACTENLYGNRGLLAQALWLTLTSVDGPPRWHSPLKSTNLLNIPRFEKDTQSSTMDENWDQLKE
jgi:hypothetical protein